uniref:LytR family transcriptional regulator n=1 Tax=Pseudothermotoga hypogea TaxID=57487 RepID=A0A832IB92_9THEM
MKLVRTLAILTLTVTLSALLFLTLICGWLFEFFLYREPEVNPYSLLVVGVDAMIEGTRRADAIMIALINHKDRRIMISSVPRDLLLQNSKINATYARSGISGLEQTLSKLLDINFNGVVVVDYAAFKYLGDELGPVEIHIKEPMKYVDSVQKLYIDFQPGVYLMRGDELLAYIRYRKGPMGDLSRIERQKEVLMKLVENARHTTFQKLLSMFKDLQKNVDLKVSTGELVYLFSKLRKGFSVDFVSFPYMINEQGDVVLDEKKLAAYKQTLKEMKTQAQKETFRIVLINAGPDKTRVFLERHVVLWNRVSLQPSLIVWEDVGLSFRDDVVFVLDKNTQEALKGLLKSVYPEKTFTFTSLDEPSTLKNYFELIDKLSKNRIYVKFPIDAFVVVR